MNRKRARILTGIALAIAALGLLYGIAVGVSAYKLHRACAALAKEGRPMSLADITPPRIPDSQNAALLYESAALLLKAQPAPKHDLLKYLTELSVDYLRGNADPNKTVELERLLQSDVVRRAAETVEQGAQRPSCQFDFDYAAGLHMHVPSASSVRNLAWVLGAKACFESKTGHPDEAWQTIHTQIRLANGLRNEPIMMGQLVRYSSLDASCLAIRVLCRAAPPTSGQARDVEEAFRDYDSITPLVLAADGERLIFGEQLFNLPKSEQQMAATDFLEHDQLPSFLQQLLYWRITFKPLFLADHAAYLDWNRKAIHLLEDPDFLDKVHAFTNEFYATQKHHFLTSIRAPTFVSPAVFHYQLVANIRITLTGLALLQYRQANGGFPESLDALDGQNVEDPFSKKPLIYRREDGGFVLYSVGEDRKDNGGRPREAKGGKEYDFVWKFEDGGSASNTHLSN
jgi:hypothetical protein